MYNYNYNYYIIYIYTCEGSWCRYQLIVTSLFDLLICVQNDGTYISTKSSGHLSEKVSLAYCAREPRSAGA